MKSQLSNIENRLFKAKLIDWPDFSNRPFCKLISKDNQSVSFGELNDHDDMKYVIMLENGFDEDDFSSNVKKKAQLEEKKFQT